MSGNTEPYPVVRVGHGQATHALETFGWHSTFCGMSPRYHGVKGAGDSPVTCKRCRRSLEARPATNLRARATLAIGAAGSE